jgi:glycosyltransferase involved in cell wall biosynthesis
LVDLAILGTRGIPARYGGFETFAEQLAIRLAEKGIHVTVFCPSDGAKADTVYRNVTLRYIPSTPLGKFTEMIWDARCFWAARRGFRVVYMLGVGASFAAWLPRVYGSHVWINPDGIEWKRAKWSLPQRIYLALAEALGVLFASRIIADANAIAQYLSRKYPPLRRISTIAYGAEIPAGQPEERLLQEWNLTPDGYYLVVCRLEPENHVLEIIEGFESSQSPLPLIILGRVESPNAYVRQLLRHRSERIRFAGTVFDAARLAALRYYTRAYIHGHSVGGTNPSLLEAMACSSLVIAHDNPFNREVLGETCLFFSTRKSLADAINQVDAGIIDARPLRSHALERVHAEYTWDRIASLYFDLLQSGKQ